MQHFGRSQNIVVNKNFSNVSYILITSTWIYSATCKCASTNPQFLRIGYASYHCIRLSLYLNAVNIQIQIRIIASEHYIIPRSIIVIGKNAAYALILSTRKSNITYDCTTIQPYSIIPRPTSCGFLGKYHLYSTRCCSKPRADRKIIRI